MHQGPTDEHLHQGRAMKHVRGLRKHLQDSLPSVGRRIEPAEDMGQKNVTG